MKWIKVAIGVVIAIVSLGIIATSVNDMTRETMKTEVVTFEILTETTITSGTYDALSNYDNDTQVLLKVNNGLVFNDTIRFLKDGGEWSLEDYNTSYSFVIYDDNTFNNYTLLADVSISDTFELTFEVLQPPQLTGISATLIILAPLIFVGGVLVYLMQKQDY